MQHVGQQMVFHLLDKLVLIIKLNIKRKYFFLDESFLIKKLHNVKKEFINEAWKT